MKCLVLFLLVSTQAFGRWATKEDFSSIVLDTTTEIKVKKDGTYSVYDITTYQILNEAGKARFNLMRIPFSSSTSSMKILEASVTNGASVTKVTPDKIVVVDVSNKDGLSDAKELQIAFPQVQVGSKVFLKFTENFHKAIVPGHFSYSTYFGDGEYTQSGVIKITSEVPLFMSKNDPHSSFEIIEGVEGKNYSYKVTLKGAFFHQLVQEKGFLPKEKISKVYFSSNKDWTELGENFKKRFDASLKVPVPKELIPVIEEAKKLPTDEAKVDHILAYMTKHFNYMGDWRTLEGGFAPRKPTSIINTKYGDCKDFSTVLTVMLRQIGLKADIALVHRSSPIVGLIQNTDLPKINLFNHAIVRVISDGKSYWVDPTNKQSYGLNHREDIAGKKALVLEAPYKLEDIPLYDESKNQIVLSKTMDFISEENIPVTANLKMNGDTLLYLVGEEDSLGKEKLEAILFGFASQGEEQLFKEFSSYDFKSKSYKELDINLKYMAKNAIRSEDGKKFAYIPTIDMYLAPLNFDTHQGQGDIFLSSKTQIRREFFLKNVFADKRPEGCFVDSKWIKVKRDFTFEKDGLRVKDEVFYKENYVKREEFESTDMKLLFGNIRTCLNHRTVEFTPGSKNHVEGLETIEAKFAKLPVQKRVMSRFNYVVSVAREEIKSGLTDDDQMKLLKKNIEEDPKHMMSYFMLAKELLQQGYYNGNNYSPASLQASRQVIQEGLKLEPNHQGLLLCLLQNMALSGNLDQVKKSIPTVLGMAKMKDIRFHLTASKIYDYLKEPDKGVLILNQGLKLAKSKWEKKNVLFNLAVLNSTIDPKKTVYYYEEVLKTHPEDSYTLINLSNAYVEFGRYDDAVRVTMQGHMKKPGGMMSDRAAAALRARAGDYYSKKNYELAENDYKASIMIREDSDAYIGLANLAFAKGEKDKVISLVEAGSKSFEGEVEEYYFKTAQYYMPYDSLVSLRLYEKVLEQAKKPMLKLDSYSMMNILLARMQRMDEAKALAAKELAYVESVVASNPDDPQYKMKLLGALSRDMMNGATPEKKKRLMEISASLQKQMNRKPASISPEK